MANSAFQSSIANLDVSQKISQDGSEIYAADGGGTDSYSISLSPSISSYTVGQVVNFKANTPNTGAATLNIDSVGAQTIKKNHDQTLDDNDIEAGQIVTVVWDGTNWQMQSQIANTGGGGSGSGIILQSESNFSASGSANSTGTYTDVSGSSVTITPTSASNSILVRLCFGYKIATGNNDGQYRVQRDGSNILSAVLNENEGGTLLGYAWEYLDSPATTSAVTYVLQHRTLASTITTQEVGITVQEVEAP